jgi:hypothetical protein
VALDKSKAKWTWPKQGWKTEIKSSRCICTSCKGL